jgi:hypothetical protein
MTGKASDIVGFWLKIFDHGFARTRRLLPNSSIVYSPWVFELNAPMIGILLGENLFSFTPIPASEIKARVGEYL